MTGSQRVSTEGRPIAILVALAEERRALRPLLRNPRRESRAGLRYLRGTMADTDVVLLATGMGVERARNIALAAIEVIKPAALIATGFAGAAAPDLATGDIVIAASIRDLPPPHGTGPRRIPIDEDLLAVARTIGVKNFSITTGELATTRRIVGSPAEKKKLHDQHGIHAIDMESLGVARAANVHDTPLLCVRAIVDDVSTPLPLDLGALVTATGHVRVLVTIAAIARRPRAVTGLIDLRTRSRRAGRNLAVFLERLVPAVKAAPSGGE